MRSAKPRPPLDAAALYDHAVRALGRRMRSVAELKRLLRQRIAAQPDADDLIDEVIQRLKEQRYLNDTAYAQAYSTLRKENDKFGRQRVVSELKTRGVHGDVIAKTVGEAYDGVNEERLARAFLQRKRLKEPANEKEAARVFRALLRAGFTSKTIFTILKKWNVDDDTLAAFESIDSESGS